MVGMLFYLFRHRIAFDGRRAALAACALAALMFVPAVAEAAFAVLGGYLIFWFGFQVRSPTLASVGVQQDFSYGVYLYGWPMQQIVVWLIPGSSPWAALLLTIAFVTPLAAASWYLVEKPALALKRPTRRESIAVPL